MACQQLIQRLVAVKRLPWVERRALERQQLIQRLVAFIRMEQRLVALKRLIERRFLALKQLIQRLALRTYRSLSGSPDPAKKHKGEAIPPRA